MEILRIKANSVASAPCGDSDYFLGQCIVGQCCVWDSVVCGTVWYGTVRLQDSTARVTMKLSVWHCGTVYAVLIELPLNLGWGSIQYCYCRYKSNFIVFVFSTHTTHRNEAYEISLFKRKNINALFEKYKVKFLRDLFTNLLNIYWVSFNFHKLGYKRSPTKCIPLNIKKSLKKLPKNTISFLKVSPIWIFCGFSFFLNLQ